jgi:hypothetical protein
MMPARLQWAAPGRWARAVGGCRSRIFSPSPSIMHCKVGPRRAVRLRLYPLGFAGLCAGSLLPALPGLGCLSPSGLGPAGASGAGASLKRPGGGAGGGAVGRACRDG